MHVIQNMKKLIEILGSLFFYNVGPTLAQILPQRYTHFTFLADFQWNMLGDTINSNNLCCNAAVLKKVGKAS